MNTLITPAEVFDLAFSHEEMYNASVVTDLDIAAVEERYLIPILGRTMYEAISGGEYDELKTNFIAPMVAAWTRYMLEPLLASRCGLCHETKATSAENTALEERRQVLRQRARILTRTLSDNLNAAAYPEYDPKQNPLNRCSIDGNIVQIY